jgi:hypothetical protein
MAEEQLVRAYHNGTVYSFERANRAANSYFGGPMEDDVIGMEHGPRSLHHVVHLAAHDLPCLAPISNFGIPLVYAFCFNGCSLRYSLKRYGTIKITEMGERSSSEDFPYRNYPQLLPFIPLRTTRHRASSYERFANEFPNMPEVQPTELIVVVPPPATIGISLWGSSGDAEEVTVVFECDLKAQTVHAYNVCT